MGKTCLWWPITKLVEIITSIHVYLIQRMNFGSKENGRENAFLAKPKRQNILHPNEKNMLLLANPKISGEYPCLSHSLDEFCFKGKWQKKSYYCKTKAPMSCT